MRPLFPFALCAASMLTGCVTVEQKQAAIEAVNDAFRECYEATLRGRGVRGYPVSKERAMDAVRGALESLGMRVVSSDALTGDVVGQGAAPAPLDDAEWRGAVERDLPQFRRIVANEVGLLGWFVDFEPQGLDIAIRVSTVEARRGVDLLATMRMVERTPPPSGWPRREYPPCTALEVGLDKLWRAIDERLL